MLYSYSYDVIGGRLAFESSLFTIGRNRRKRNKNDTSINVDGAESHYDCIAMY